jgi:uncharacterized protein YcbK (DUF882 family)
MTSRALCAYLGALVGLTSTVPLAGDPAPPLTYAGHSRKPAPSAPEAAPAAPTDPSAGAGAAGSLPAAATLVNVHSGEALVLDERAPTDARFSRLLPDRTSGETHEFDGRLLATLRRVAERHPGARIELVSGFRSPKFNEQLRKKGHRVASHSEHSRGHAVDFRVEGLTPAEIVAELRALGWKGGLGRYDRPSDRFVHFDVGRERFWMGH